MWEEDKRITDPYLPMVKAICGAYVLAEPPVEEDREHNTDLMVLNMDGVRIAVRLRSPHYWKQVRYRDEFTIRDSRPRGKVTEFAKILQGFGEYFFYGFRTEKPPHLWGFGLLDLCKFRSWTEAYCAQWARMPGTQIPNGDQSSTFRAIRWDVVPPEAIVVMWPKKIAIGPSLMTPEIQDSIQLAMGLLFPE